MIVYGYELDNLVRTSNFVPYRMKKRDQYEVGKYYWNGYWKKYFKVLEVEYGQCGYLSKVTVEWQDGRITTHSTPPDRDRDYRLQKSFLDPTKKVVNSKVSYKGAEIKALCCLGAIPEDCAEFLMDEYYSKGKFAPNDEIYYFVGVFHEPYLKRDLLKSERRGTYGSERP